MNRRELFALLSGAVAAPSELWTPSRKIFLPPRGGWPRGHIPYVSGTMGFYGNNPVWHFDAHPIDNDRYWGRISLIVDDLKRANA